MEPKRKLALRLGGDPEGGRLRKVASLWDGGLYGARLASKGPCADLSYIVGEFQGLRWRVAAVGREKRRKIGCIRRRVPA